MNKKTLSILVGVLLFSFASASLIPYISNQVTGAVSVEGPVFYAVSGAGAYGDPGNLSINEFIGHGTTYKILGGDTKYFKSEKVGPMSFYAPKLNLSVEAYLANGTNPNLLKLEFGYYNTFTQGTQHSFCDVLINVTSVNQRIYSDTCNGSSTNKLEAFYYSIQNLGTNDVKIKVKTFDESTKVEVLGVAN